MKHWKITIKERGGALLTPESYGEQTREDIVSFYGLDEPDVEWYRIEECDD